MKKYFCAFAFILLTSSLFAVEDIDGIIKNAVDGLASRLIYPLEVSVGGISLAGTDSPSAFSRYLSNRIISHAPNNRMFKVVSPSRGIQRVNVSGPGKGHIKGVFMREGSIVRVTLQLISEPDGAILESRDFAVPVAELDRLGYAILPENIKDKEELVKREEIINPPSPAPSPVPSPEVVASAFILKAWPDSDTRTYVDGDELKINIEADKTCFFKVYHIDKDGTMQLIHPNSSNIDNRLTANVVRTIPEGSGLKYSIQAPFGQDTIMVVASTQQFNNITAEFNQAWHVSSDTIRLAASSRGLGMQITPGGPEAETVKATFNFTSLPANYSDASFSYPKPANMAEAVKAMRDDALRQGGTFSGNEREGVFNAAGTSGSYSVSGNTVIVKARYSGNQLVPARGVSTFNFSIDKPRNIAQAVQSVKSGIEGKGGSFSGNDQQGNFRGSGITGRYSIADRVNVSISEKPILIPNSLIEKEVRNYFTGK